MQFLLKVIATGNLAYHGTTKDVKRLEMGSHTGTGAGSLYGDAIYFTDSLETATRFAKKTPTSRVFTVDISNLKIFDSTGKEGKAIAKTKLLPLLKKLYPDTEVSTEYLSAYDSFSGLKDAFLYSNTGSISSIPEIVKSIRDLLVKVGFDGLKAKQGDGEIYYAIYKPEKLKVLEIKKMTG